MTVMPPVAAQSCWLFDTEIGLPTSLVSRIVEDADHCIWVGSEDGLSRFDGTRVVTFRTEAGNPHSLQDNYVRALCVTPDGHLLVGTRNGLQVYRNETNDFSLQAAFENGQPALGDVTQIIVRRNGEIWCSGNLAYSVRLESDGTPVALYNPFTGPVHLAEDLTEDAEGRVWIARRLDQLYRLDRDNSIQPLSQDGLRPFSVVFGSQNGMLYAGGSQPGLYRYDDGQFVLVGTDPHPNYIVCSLLDLDAYRLLVGTDNAGLLVYDMRTQSIAPYPIDDGRVSRLDPQSFKVHGICRDSEGTLWLSLYQQGVLAIPEVRQPFKVYSPLSRVANCIGDKCVTSMAQGEKGHFWVATDNGGLFSVDKEGHQLSHFEPGPGSQQVPSSLMGLYADSRHRLWYGSYNQGYGCIEQGRLQRRTEPHLDIYDFVEDPKGRIWACTMGQGIYCSEGKNLQFDNKVDNLLSLWCNALYYDSIGDDLYVGTFNGMTIVRDICQSDSTMFDVALGNDIVFAITRFSGDTLAMATNHGLLLYNSRNADTLRFTTAHGLPTNLIYGVECDGQGTLWVSGNAGLASVRPSTGAVTHYTADDGLQGNEFYKNATLRDSDGALWFGGPGGLTWFRPEDIAKDEAPCRVRITDIVVGGQSLPLSCHRFSDDDKAISFQLGTLPLLCSRRAQYSYQLDNDPWVTIPAQSSHATMSHLSGGEHVFRFRAAVNGVLSEVSEYEFRIDYPWYMQWWSLILWLLILMTFVQLAWMQFNHRMMVRRRLQKYVQARAIDEAKLDFFINISHEIRTPMTMIISPLQKLILEDGDAARQRSYELILRNSNRIIGLINQLMDVRKIEKKQLQLSFSPVQIGPYIQQIVETFSDLADQRQLQLNFQDGTPAGQELWIDSQNFDKILVNLLSNAFRHTPSGGVVSVEMSVEEGQLVLSVTDSGEGIPKESRARIFDRFYQVHPNQSRGGTGIGLHLTSSLVGLHGGTIRVTDPVSLPTNVQGPGISFILTFPLGNGHLRPEQLSKTEEKLAEPQHEDLMSLIDVSAAKEAPAPSVTASDTVRRQILVAEDDDEIRRFIASELSAKYNVLECSNGREALDTLLQQEPDLLISDIMMPGMDGLTLCDQVRKNVRINHIPIVLLTAKTTDEDRLQGLSLGADAYLTKPFNIKVLLQTVESLLHSRARLRNAFSGKQLPAEQIDTPESKTPDEKLMERILRVVNANLSNPELTTEMVAQEVGVSRVHLYRKLKELANQSAHSFIRNIRLAKAAEMLEQKNLPIAEVSLLVGFSSPAVFSVAFKNLYGKTPTAYIEEKRNEANAAEPR